MNVAMTIVAYEALVERAQALAHGYPYNTDTTDAHDDIFRLTLTESGAAELSWVEYDSGYHDDPGSCATCSVKFPVELLTMPANEVEAWRDNHRKESERRAAEEEQRLRVKRESDKAAATAAKEASDRREYLRLKAKYEASQ